MTKTATQVSQRTNSLVTFSLAEQVYALPIEPIVQIVEMVAITSIPNVNRSVEGVINYHGTTIPVINLRQYLGMPAVPLDLDMHIMIVLIAERTIGLIVDSVRQVIEVTEEQIARADDILPDEMGKVAILRGVLHTPAGGAVLVLDLEHLFSAQQVQALVRVSQTLLPDTDLDTDDSQQEELA